MSEDNVSLNRQIEQLNKKINMLKQREEQNNKYAAELFELQRFLDGVRRFMLGLMQGYVPFQMVSDHIGHKASQEELRKLYEAALNQPRHVSRKALIIIYFLYGLSHNIIMDFLYISRNTVKRNIHKYQTHGVDSLLDTRHTTIKKRDEPKIRELLLSILHSPPSAFGYNRTSWTLKLLKLALENEGYSIARNDVSIIIKKAGYRFWKAKEVLTSNDPKYKEKLESIKKILSNLKPTEKFFSIDEFGPFAVKERGGRRLVQKGEYPSVPQFQPSKGALIVTAALELSTNQVTHFYSARKNSAEIIKLLHILISNYTGCKTIYMSWDHASWHSSKVLFSEIARVNKYSFRRKSKTPLVKLAPLPARAQFLNVIESVFSGMAAAIIQNSNYESVDHAKEAIDRYFKERNEYFRKHPKRAGNKIWGNELVPPTFKEGQNCKNPKWR